MTDLRYGEPNSSTSPPHEQSSEPSDPESFTHAQFVAYLKDGSLKFDKYGSLEMTFAVTPQHVDNAMDLRKLTSQGIPVSIDIQPYKRYMDRVAENLTELAKVSADLVKTEVVDG